MSQLAAIGQHLDSLLASYGYAAVFVLVILECTGVPMPGETMLITAAAYAGATHRLEPALVIATAAAAAILGDNAGFAVGRFGGVPLLERYGRLVHVDHATLKVGRYLYERYGGRVVFFGRFVPVLRTWGALLAGANRLPWRRFLVFNAASGIAWATLWGGIAAMAGTAVSGVAGNVAILSIVVASTISVAAGALIARDRDRLQAKAEARFPG